MANPWEMNWSAPGGVPANTQVPKPSLPVQADDIDSPIPTQLIQDGRKIMDQAQSGEPVAAAPKAQMPWDRDWKSASPPAPVAEQQTPADFRGDGAGAGTSIEAALIGARQGITFGLGDEINAGVRAAGDWIGGKPFGEAYDERLAHERGLLAQVEEENPVASTVGEIGGAMMMPLGAAGSSTTLAGAAARGAATGAATGAAYGAGNAEGGAGERLEGAVEGAALGALFGAGANAVVYGGTKTAQALMKRSVERPSIETLKVAKNAAYKAVDDAGETFSPQDMQAIALRAREAIEAGNYVPDVDKQTAAALTLLDRNSAKPQTLGQLDKLRQNLWTRYKASTSEVGVLDAINAIDDAIASRTDTNELMLAARAAHARFKKAELLDAAFKKAADQTASSGSGGNILNKYRQSVTSIINDPKRAKWFTADERALMQSLVDGKMSDNILRRIGKLSPDGNGLMLALNLLGGAHFGVGSLAATGVAAVAKNVSDRSAELAKSRILDAVAGAPVVAPQPVRISRGIGAMAGALGGN